MIPLHKLGALISDDAKARSHAGALGGTGRDIMTPKIVAAAKKMGRFPKYAREAQRLVQKQGGEIPSPIVAALARYIIERRGGR